MAVLALTRMTNMADRDQLTWCRSWLPQYDDSDALLDLIEDYLEEPDDFAQGNPTS